MKSRTLCLVGSTGAVGKEVLAQALQNSQVGQVNAITRRPLAQSHPKLSNHVIDFDNLPNDPALWQADALICTLGTTIKQAGSAAAFQHVDLHLVAQIAAITHYAGTPCFVLNSSMMANPKARGLYLRTKGLAETYVIDTGFDSTVIARPGLLDAEREEFRLGENLGALASRLVNPVLPKRFRSVKTANLATVMLDYALKAPRGTTVLESEAFQ